MVDEPAGTVDTPSDALPVGRWSPAGSSAGSGGTASGGTGRRPARRALIVALFTLPAVLLLAIVGVSIAFWVPADTSGAPATVAETSSPRYTTVPAAAVHKAHRALHDLGAACAQDSTVRPPLAVTTAVDVLLDFATRFPDGRFRIDDENGTSLSLLLVLRDELSSCDPVLLPHVDELLPPDLREPATNE